MTRNNSQSFLLCLKITLLILFFILLSLIFTRPLIENLSTHIVGGYGDNMGFIWQIGWFKQAIFDLQQIPLKTNLLNFPYGYNLYNSEISPLQILIALPFTVVGGPVLGYNVSMLSTFVFSGLCMFYWIYSKTKSWQAGVAVGTAYAVSPFHLAHFLTGHLNISAIQWFPLFFMGLFGILENKGFSKKNVLLTGLGLVLISFSSVYYAYMSLLIAAIITLFSMFYKKSTLWKEKLFWRQLLLAGAICLPFLIISVGPYVYLHIAAGMENRELSEVIAYSASPTDFLLPFTRQPLWGKWIGDNFPRNIWTDATLYLGLPSIFLFIWGWLKRNNGNKKYFIYLCIGAMAAVVLAMGTNLTWMEKPVMLSPPQWLSGLLGKEPLPIFLPGYLLFRFLPFYGRMRAWMRYGIFAMVFICAGAGLALGEMLNKKNRVAKFAIFFVVLGLILVDFSVLPFDLSAVKPRQVDLWLAGQPWGGLVQLPIDQSFEKLNMYYTLTNQKGLIGFIKEVPSYRYFTLEAALKNFPDKTSIDSLKTEKITYVLVDETAYTVNKEFIITCQSLGLEFESSIDGQSVFIINKGSD
jgi:hypothetical protein